MHSASSVRFSPASLVATFGGIGFLPVMPGTWCSIVVASLALLVPYSALTAGIMLASAVALFALSAKAIPLIQQQWGSDPQAVVIDEAIGMFLLLATPYPYASPIWLALCVLVFRVFDVAKPWPLNVINARTEWWAVILDDVVAAGLSAVFIAIVFLFLQVGMLQVTPP